MSSKKKRKNKLHNGLKCYHNINDDNDGAETTLLTSSLSTPTLDRCPIKQLKETIANNIENVTLLFNHIQVAI